MSDVVDVGRLSASALEDVTSSSLKFKCPVVSRNHARFKFADSGDVVLLDQKSHHGTFIKRAHEGCITTLIPEVAFILGDGDRITFGKVVGRGSDIVYPVVVSVELLHNDTHPGLIDLRPLRLPISPITAPKLLNSRPHIPSGRFGLDYSSDSSSSSSELHSPEQAPYIVDRNNEGVDDIEIASSVQSSPTGPLFNNIRTTKLKDADKVAEHHPTPSYARSLSPEEHSESEEAQHGDSEYVDMDMDYDYHHDDVDHAGSEAMDLESELSVEQYDEDANVWPAESLRDSIPYENDENDDEEPPVADMAGGTASIAVVSDSREASEPALVTDVAEPAHSEALQQVQDQCARMNPIIEKLELKRERYKFCFNENVHRTNARMATFDQRLDTLTDQHNALQERVGGLNIVDHSEDVQSLRADFDKLESTVSALPTVPVTATPEMLMECDEVRVCIDALKNTVRDMDEVKGKAEAEIRAEVEAVKALRTEAVEECRMCSGFLKRKRSDSDESENENDNEYGHVLDTSEGVIGAIVDGLESSNVSALVDGKVSAPTPNSIVQANPNSNLQAIVGPTTTHVRSDGIQVPMLKRSRVSAGFVGHTVASMAVGAVAAWSALAFL
ncbi:hypothetical protein BDV98DRAFT_595854 [Pterulicium gracile]|uniref:FHA domain-containing protein n=1 Tax=Pterulicium gracile TaxID=1884261 RepID=A0A5C3QAY2_9AGAR|nr:hypothetical protein BDV98DRAFT_595854 [Pterula gracilis]